MQPSRKARVHVVGSVNEDLTLRVTRLPGPGETVLARSSVVSAGGKGANQAVAAAAAGARVAMIARVGHDEPGRRLRAALHRAGVDVESVAGDPVAPTGRASVTVADGGENAIVVAAGANAMLTADAVAAALAPLARGDVLVTQAEIPAAAVSAAAAGAARSGALLVLNLAPYRSLPPGTVPATGVLVVNASEAALLAADHDALPARAEVLAARTGCRVVITLGSGGAELACPGDAEAQRIPAPSVDAVDTTGAGDAFVGVLAAGLVEGLSLPDAAHRAGAAAGLSVTRPGAQASYPDRATIDRAAHGAPTVPAGPAA